MLWGCTETEDQSMGIIIGVIAGCLCISFLIVVLIKKRKTQVEVPVAELADSSGKDDEKKRPYAVIVT